MRVRLLALFVALVGLFGLACAPAKICYDDTIGPDSLPGVNCSCHPHRASCALDCQGRACEAGCLDNDTCDIDCTDSRYCEVLGGATDLSVDCEGATCDVSCDGAETCEVDCGGAVDCLVDCFDASCVVRDCDLDEGTCDVTCGVDRHPATQHGADARCE